MIGSLGKPQKCCGCGACAYVCPRGAITMQTDDQGFRYPVIDEEKCTHCRACMKACAFFHTENSVFNTPIKCYGAIHKSKTVVVESTSGGLFTALSDVVLQSGGTVYGAVFQDKRVFHVRAEDELIRDSMRGSKYVQSNIEQCFQNIKDDLTEGRTVLFTGTPCQVAAVYQLFFHHFNLITCEVLCYGTPSPMVFSEHLKMIERRFKGKIVNYQFRPGKHGFEWGCQNEMAILQDGREIAEDAYVNAFRQLFYGGITKRTACHSCPYTKLDRTADITIGDCRKFRIVYPQVECENGVSTVLANTEKGIKLVEACRKEVDLYDMEIEDILQEPLQHPSKQGERKSEFWKEMNTVGYERALQHYYGRNFDLKFKIKKLLKRMKIG